MCESGNHPLAKYGYKVPAAASEVVLDVVTPTCNRAGELREQAGRLFAQLGARDRWIVVDDASDGGAVDPRMLTMFAADLRKLHLVGLTYWKGGPPGSTVNRARHVSCSLARPEAWIVEVDDHDWIEQGCLGLVREAICAGASLVYGDNRHMDRDGKEWGVYEKPDYTSWLLRDGLCPCEGVRAFPKLAYELVGGYRWHGDLNEVGGNEYPGGDYGLFMRIEQLCEGRGFRRVPKVLCRTILAHDTITGRDGAAQAAMACKLRSAARENALLAKFE